MEFKINICSNLIGATYSQAGRLGIILDVEKFQEQVRSWVDPLNFLSNKVTSLGNIVSGMLGIFMIFKAVKFIFNIVFNSYLIVRIFWMDLKIVVCFFLGFSYSLVHFPVTDSLQCE